MKNRICTKFALCKPVANINLAKVCTHCVSGGLPSLHTLCKLGNHHLRNGYKPKQCRCLQQVCTRQTLCKFDFSSSVYIIYIYINIGHLLLCLVMISNDFNNFAQPLFVWSDLVCLELQYSNLTAPFIF